MPEGGPLPVEFPDVNAHQKGNGINVDWSTSREINSTHFDIEKSAMVIVTGQRLHHYIRMATVQL
ncbi:MAG: hypothetical protein M3R50_06555 [Bacteroidota bacterium]|nr:hypothetical protein [Bacteroidota bacterium]